MLLIKFNPTKAERLARTLSPLSPEAEITGYLVGLIQDTKRCVAVNLQDRPDREEVKLIEEVLYHLREAETGLSILMTSDIREGTAEDR